MVIEWVPQPVGFAHTASCSKVLNPALLPTLGPAKAPADL